VLYVKSFAFIMPGIVSLKHPGGGLDSRIYMRLVSGRQ